MNKSQNKVVVIITFLLVFLLLCNSFISAFAEDGSGTKRTEDYNKYNIVLVVDNSGSMKSTDPDSLRVEAVRYFLANMTNSGNKVGGIIFANKPVPSTGVLLSIDSASDKKKIENFFNLPKKESGTDIGSALLAATTMLDNSRDPKLPSVIILMTDGRTEDLDEKGTEQSEVNLEQAIANAKAHGYKVYCVGLNADGKVDRYTLQNIANETGGKYEEVDTSDNLPRIYAMFYDLLYGTIDNSMTIQGVFDKKFYIPAIGVEDVNITIVTSRPLKFLEISKPSGIILTEEELEKLTTVSKTFTTIKIESPDRGDWRIHGEGAENTDVTIQIRQNYNLGVAGVPKKTVDSYSANSSVSFLASILFGKEKVTNIEAYKDYSATAYLSSNLSDVVIEIPMKNMGKEYECKLPLGEMGTYFVTIELKNDYFQVFSEPFELSAGAPALEKLLDGIAPLLLPLIIGLIVLVLVFLIVFRVIKHYRSRSNVVISININGIPESINETVSLNTVNKFQFSLLDLLNVYAKEIGYGKTGETNRRAIEKIINGNAAEFNKYAFQTDAKDASKFYFWRIGEKRNHYSASTFNKRIPCVPNEVVSPFGHNTQQVELEMVGVIDNVQQGFGFGIDWEPSTNATNIDDFNWNEDINFR